MEKEKYYFVTYQAEAKGGHKDSWNQVIHCSPMEFITNVAKVELNGSQTYNQFVVINTCEISKKEFNDYCGRF